jgi:hypothetical protein
MSAGKTVFFTYLLSNTPITGTTTVLPYQDGITYGHSNAIHCNYIEKLETDSLSNKSISFIVPDGSLFPFLKESSQINSSNNGFGWTARKLYALAQIVDATGDTVTSDPANWSIIDVTSQLDGYETFSGTTIPPSSFNSSTIITISVTSIINAPKYNLNYLKYPTTLSNSNELIFGEEAFFFGNVKTDIFAIAYTTEIPAVLQLNEYNSTTNETWDELSPVTITELGIFNDNNDLVGIGKINNPITKDSTIYRTILFSIDF